MTEGAFTLEAQIAALGDRPLDRAAVDRHLRPLFSRALAAEAERGEVYLANHSLGRPLDRTADDVARCLALWFFTMDGAWGEGGWLDEATAFRAKVALLLGVRRPDAVVPKVSAGQGLRAVLNAFPQDRPLRVVTTTGEFDSTDFILKTYAEQGRARIEWVGPSRVEDGVELFDGTAVADRVLSGTDLVVVSQVMFQTGQVLPGVAELVERAHRAGAVVLADTYHSAGVIPVGFDDHGFDFAVGGCYKYLRGGPGAGFLAVDPGHLDGSRFRTLDTGWFAKRDTFGYGRSDRAELAEGGDAWLESTPAVVTSYQASAGLDFTLGVGVARTRYYALELQAGLREALGRAGVPVHRPADPEAFGGFVLVPHPDAPSAAARMLEYGVNVDARGGAVRFGPDLLSTPEEFGAAAEAAAQVWRL